MIVVAVGVFHVGRLRANFVTVGYARVITPLADCVACVYANVDVVVVVVACSSIRGASNHMHIAGEALPK